jgi:hypothetical protein
MLRSARVAKALTHALHVEQLIAQYITNRTQFTGITVTAAQQIGCGIAAPVIEFRKINGDQREQCGVICNQFCRLIRCQPDGDF